MQIEEARNPENAHIFFSEVLAFSSISEVLYNKSHAIQ